MQSQATILITEPYTKTLMNFAITCQIVASAVTVYKPAMELIGEYDEIDLPPIRPYVIRHRRFACACTHCGAPVKGLVPAVATGTPFGKRIHALTIYLKGFQALSNERLRGMLFDIFGLAISEGALMNIFMRSHASFELEADIRRQCPAVCSTYRRPYRTVGRRLRPGARYRGEKAWRTIQQFSYPG